MRGKITIPEDARHILKVLHDAGYEAYVVGGCVRDALLGREPGDWDITTSAKPEQVKALFRRTIDTGIQHGTVTVMMHKVGYEVTTYRIDGQYEDHRHPTEVSFTSELREDMRRRDFTINAMAYSEEEGVVDYFEGQKDLERGVIRCVGNPMERFDEDALRVLRALRFAGQRDFTIEENTVKAMKQQSIFLKDVSAERIRVELTKLLLCAKPEYLETIGRTTGIVAIVLPELEEMFATEQNHPHHCYNVGKHCMEATVNVKNTQVLRWAALLHDIGKPKTYTVDEQGTSHFYKHAAVGAPMAADVLKRLKFDNDTVKRVRELIYWHDYNWGQKVSIRQVRRAMCKIGPEYMEDLLALQKADVLAQSSYMQQEKLALLEEIVKYCQQIVEEKQCVTMKTLAINGNDLMQMGMKPGKALGEVLHRLLDLVVEEPDRNTKEQLEKIAAEWITQDGIGRL